MKKHLLMKTLLVALVCLVGGTSSVWGGTKTLYSQNYESATNASSWVTQNLAPTLQTGDATYGNYIQLALPQNGNSRSTYTNWGNSFYGDYTTYTLEFDANITNGTNQESSFAIMSDGYTLPSANSSYNSIFLFQINSTDADRTNYRVNGSSSTLALPSGVWCHFSIVVNSGAKTAVYTITNKTTSAQVATGTYNIPDGTSYKAVGMYYRCGRYNGVGKFDNISITTETDEEVVGEPVISTAYAGDNRTVTITGGSSSESNTVTTYYTTDGSNPTSSSTEYTGTPINITENCTVKAISISSTGVESTISSIAVTVGKLTLNAPTFTKTGYSAGSYTISIAHDQSGLEFVPASTTIKYRIGNTGEFTTYSAPVEVTAGSILYAYVEADNYTTSSTSEVCAVAIPAMTLAWSENFKGKASSDFQMEITTNGGPISKGIAVVGDANYFIPSEDGTNMLTNANIGFYVAYSSNGNHRRWKMYSNGTTGIWNMVNANVDVHLYNLKAGQVVKVNGSALYAGGGVLAALTAFDYATTRFYQVTADGTGTITVSNQGYINNIEVYDPDNEIVGAMNNTTSYNTATNATPIWINAGETGYYKFKNYNNGGSILYQNWYLFAENVGGTHLAAFGPNHTNTPDSDKGSYTSRPTFTNADLNGATVELTATLADAGNDTYTLTVTGVTTKADGTTTLSPNLVYTQTGLDVSKLQLYISPEMNFLELLEQNVSVTVTDAGFATYVPSNDLDFSATSIEAYKVKVSSKGVATLTKVNNVPAGTPVLLYKDGGKTEDIPVMTGAAAVSDNDLVAGTGAAVATTVGEYTNMILNNVGGNVGFYFAADQTVATNRAYLHFANALAPAAAARMTMIFEDDDVTGVNEVRSQKEDVRSEWFDLQGRKVAQPQKGLYIVNGKKVMVK